MITVITLVVFTEGTMTTIIIMKSTVMEYLIFILILTIRVIKIMKFGMEIPNTLRRCQRLSLFRFHALLHSPVFCETFLILNVRMIFTVCWRLRTWLSYFILNVCLISQFYHYLHVHIKTNSIRRLKIWNIII